MRLDRYDSIIIGAGHNGLVCAAYLAKGGQRVVVLEASDTAGGLGASREFYPGFHASVAHSVSHFSRKISNDLNLTSHGYETTSNTLPTIGLGTDQEHVVLHDDTLSGSSSQDSDAYQNYSRLMQRFAGVLRPFWLKTMPQIGNIGLGEMMTFAHIGLNLRLLGKKDMREFLRIASLPARDLLYLYF
jgi:phytoene dehydrogenase-like protein